LDGRSAGRRLAHSPLNQKTMNKEEKLKHLKAEIKAAEESGDEEYLKYVINIRDSTINFTVEDGGVLIVQSGSPPPLPPYK
jgi:hypothetical protein